MIKQHITEDLQSDGEIKVSARNDSSEKKLLTIWPILNFIP